MIAWSARTRTQPCSVCLKNATTTLLNSGTTSHLSVLAPHTPLNSGTTHTPQFWHHSHPSILASHTHPSILQDLKLVDGKGFLVPGPELSIARYDLCLMEVLSAVVVIWTPGLQAQAQEGRRRQRKQGSGGGGRAFLRGHRGHGSQVGTPSYSSSTPWRVASCRAGLNDPGSVSGGGTAAVPRPYGGGNRGMAAAPPPETDPH